MKQKLSRWIDWALYAALAAMVVTFVVRRRSGPDEGKPAALFDLALVDKPSERYRLADQRGKPVLIEVFAGWCGVCRQASPALNQAWQRHGRGKVEFLGVSVDESAEEALRVKRAWEIPYEVVHDDGSISKGYGIQVLPTVVLVGRDGRVLQVATGALSAAQLDGWLADL